MRIIALTNDELIIRQIAELLINGFRGTGTEAWVTLDAVITEVRESLSENRISRVAIAEDGTVLGWIGGIEKYDGFVWELHPLVVRPARRGRGIGSALVTDLEAQVKARGGTTICVGTDDEDNRTSMGGVNLYPDVLGHLQNIKNLRHHPFEFYQKLGYVITGVIPDANGFGKPDILMAKRIL